MDNCVECLKKPEGEQDCYHCDLDPRSYYIKQGYSEDEADYMWLGPGEGVD